MIALTGATGTIGGALLRILADAGEEVRALSRRPPEGEVPPSVTWAEADLMERATLPRVLEGADRLFLLTGNVETAVRAQQNAIRAAVQARVRHVVKLSALGASDHSKSVIGVWHWVVEQELQRSGLAWTILRPHVFMQNVLAQAASIRSRGEVRSPAGDAAVPRIDTRDIAAASAAVLTGSGHEEKRYTLTGPAPVAWQEVADTLSDVLGYAVRYVAESENDAWHRLHGSGQPPWLVGAQLSLAEYQREGGGTDVVTDTVERLTGRPARTFRTFVADHADRFLRARSAGGGR